MLWLFLLCPFVSAQFCTNTFPTGNNDITLASGRQFTLYVPSDLRDGIPKPLLLHFHGCGTLNTTNGPRVDNPDYEAELTNMSVAAEAQKWILAYPIGLPANCAGGLQPLGFNAGSCCGGVKQDDVGFSRDIVAYLSKTMCIDSGNVFASGFSNGGMMANRLGCEAADLFKAIAPHSGNIQLGGDFTSCQPSRPVSYLAFCGNQDPICVPGWKAAHEQWSTLNKCSNNTIVTYLSDTTTCQRYTPCTSGVVVEYCFVTTLPHNWSGGNTVLRPPPQSPANIVATNYIFTVLSQLLG